MKTPLLITLFICLLCHFNGRSQGLPLPYYTGFDNTTEKAGWTQFRTGYLSTFSWSNNNGVLSHDYNVGGAPTQTVVDWFVSPALDFTNTATISFKVKTAGFGVPTPDNCEVYFSSKTRNPALNTYTLIGAISLMQPKYTWLDTSFAIPFTTDSGYIAFRYKTIGAAWATYEIDSITVIGDPSTVAIPEIGTESTHSGIYPNPFTEGATLSFKATEQATLRIYDGTGKQVRQIDHISGNHYFLKREELGNGLYFFELEPKDAPRIKGKLYICDH